MATSEAEKLMLEIKKGAIGFIASGKGGNTLGGIKRLGRQSAQETIDASEWS